MTGTPPSAFARPSRVRHAVLAALLAITALNYAQRNCISPAETTLRADLGLTMQQTGDAISVFFLAYAALQVPSGWLAQRWGARKALSLFAAGWSLALGLCALAQGLSGLLGARLLMGALQAGIFPCATLVLVAWYPASQRGVTTALLNSFMLTGGAAGSMLSGPLLGWLGWRWLFALYALPGLAWAVWFAVWFHNRPEDHPSVNPAELAFLRGAGGADEPPSEPHPESVPWGRIFLSAALWWICLQQFCRAGALRLFDAWLATYLQQGRGSSVLEAGQLASLPQWAGVVGGLAGGALSDFVLVRTGSRRAGRQGVAVASLVAATACYGLAYRAPDLGMAVAVLSAGAFVAMFAAPCAYALTMDLGGRHLGVVFGTMNMAGNLGAWAFSWAVPRLVDWRGWDAALALFAALHVVAALGWLALNPRGTIGEPPATPAER